MKSKTSNLYNKILAIKSKQALMKYYSVKKINIDSSTNRVHNATINISSARSNQNKTINTSINGSKTTSSIKLEAIVKRKQDTQNHDRLLEEELQSYRIEIEYKYSHSKANNLYVFPKIISVDQLEDYINEEDESEGILNSYLCTLPSTIFYKREKINENIGVLNKSGIEGILGNSTLLSKEDSIRSSKSKQDYYNKQKKQFGRNNHISYLNIPISASKTKN